MTANVGMTFNWGAAVLHYIRQPVRLVRSYPRSSLRADIIAGMTVAVVALPNGIAFAVIADLPPKMGLYAVIMGAIFGALWGASNQAVYGPANAISLLVAAALSETLPPGTTEFIIGAGLMAVMVGLFRLVMGLLRLGLLVNFVSHSVTVGFAAGAGLLIVIKQIGPLIGVHLNTANPFAMIQDLIGSWSLIHWPTFLLGSSGILFLILLRRVRPQAPAPLILIALTTGLSIFLQLNEQGVAMIGEIPRSLPPLTAVSLWDLQLIARLSTGALAVGAIGLVQTSAIVRSIASQTGQRVDNNQEFVAQGMANLAAGFFSGYPCAASFSRTAVNYRSGAKSPVAAIFSGLFVLFAMLVLAPLAVFLPVPVLAGLLIITAYGMIDKAEIKRIWQGARGDA
ncbi:MAG: SulP family inorganic anion transporter, partial [Anaerolineae bacterium]